MTPSTPIIWTGRGPVQIGKFDPVAGRADQGYLVDVHRIGCATSSLTTTLAREMREIRETCTTQRMLLDEFEKGKSLTVSLSMLQFSGRELAAALFGAADTRAAGTVTAEQLPVLAPGDYFNLRHPKVSSVVITDSTGGTPLTYVAGTHYEIEDAAHGRCRLIAHPASHVEPVQADYAHGAAVNIRAFSQLNVERGIIFNATNHRGQHARLIIPRINLAMDGGFDWMTEDEATLTLGGGVRYTPELEPDPDYGGFARVTLFD